MADEDEVFIPVPTSSNANSGILSCISYGDSSSSSVQQHISLEARLKRPDVQGSLGFILTHPHPKFGGNLHNNVPAAFSQLLCRETDINCILRFNFRGVGKSGGSSSWSGEDERADIKAIIAYVKLLPSPPQHIILIGYSFGSCVSFSALSEFEDAQVSAAVAIGYPCGFWSSFLLGQHFARAQSLANTRKLFVIGTVDQFAGISTFDTFYNAVQGEKQKVVVKGADHFWFHRESELVDIVLGWLKEQKLLVSTKIVK